MVDLSGSLEALVERLTRLGVKDPERPEFPPLFIVGTPRSGTTVVYQHLVNAFRCAYVPNVSERFDHAPVAAARAGLQLGRRDASYESDFGETDGMLGPSDGWNLFHRWFPRYDLDEAVDPDVDSELPRVVAGLEAAFDAPFFNKNNHNSVRLERLTRIFPDGIVVRVTRDPAATTLSLLRAREKHDVPVGEWWSCPAPQFPDEAFESQVAQAAATVTGIEAHLDRQVDELSPERAVRVEYEAFCEAPDDLAENVRERYEAAGVALKERPERPAPSLQASIPADVPDEVHGWLEHYRERLEDGSSLAP
jgi:hypothetical protein